MGEQGWRSDRASVLGYHFVGPSKRLVASSVLASRRRETHNESCEFPPSGALTDRRLLRPELAALPTKPPALSYS
jgi:hypothetical protein